MASYKVPQDVEADDKLIGPFSFRQFIYLIIVAAAGAIAFFLSKIFIGLIIPFLPVMIFFGALALPLKKDQPMETYLAAIVSFYIKPRKRLWSPDGIQSLVQITAPKVIEVQRTKEFGQDEAERRLSYLAGVVDSHGWSVRGVQQPSVSSSMNTDVYNEAQQTEDILDTSGRTAAHIQNQLGQTDARHREELVARMRQPSTPGQATDQTARSQPSNQIQTPQINDPYANLGTPTYNPYPTMHQSVIHPDGNSRSTTTSQQPTTSTSAALRTPAKTTSEKPISPDIMNLANNRDLSIETIAHEANRIKQKEEAGLPKDEVVISLH